MQDMVEVIPSEQDEAIYAAWESGKTLRVLAREFGISPLQVEQAIDRCLPVFSTQTQMRACPCPAQALFLGRYPSKKCQYHRHNLHATVFKPGTRTIQVFPKDLRVLPGHPEPAVSWHSGFRGGAHARPETAPVHHAARRRGGCVAARGARAAARDAGSRISQQQVTRRHDASIGRVSPRSSRWWLRR